MKDTQFSGDINASNGTDLFVSSPPEFILQLMESVYPDSADAASWKDAVMRLARAVVYPLCFRRSRGEQQLSQRLIRQHLPLPTLGALYAETVAAGWPRAACEPLDGV